MKGTYLRCTGLHPSTTAVVNDSGNRAGLCPVCNHWQFLRRTSTMRSHKAGGTDYSTQFDEYVARYLQQQAARKAK